MSGLKDLNLLRAFVRIVECGSISGAARVMNVSQPTLSRHLRQLERSVGLELLRRDTHTMSLTAAGRRLALDARELLGLAEIANDNLRAERETPKGHLRIMAVMDFGQWIVTRLLAKFQQQHPEITVELHLTNRPSKFIEEGFDCGVLVGEVTDITTVARKIAESHRLLVASPSVLKKHGTPTKPAELKQLPWMGVLQPHFYSRDRVQLQRGQEQRIVKLTPVMLLDSVTALREAAIAGAGLTLQPHWLVGDALESGELVRVLPEWKIPSMDIHVAYPPNKHLPGRLRTFVDFASAELPVLLHDFTHPEMRAG